MIISSILLFAIAAVLGLLILIKWLGNKNVSRSVVYGHGIFAVLAFVLLLLFAYQHPDHFPSVALILFAIAALAGIYMFIKDLKGKYSPMALAVTHGLVAVAAFISLLIFALA